MKQKHYLLIKNQVIQQKKKRIENAGGRVAPLPGYGPDEDAGPDRVWLADVDVPGLAMSRSIGDDISHTVGVIHRPVVTKHKIKPEDLFMVMASDGVWEFMDDFEAVKVAMDTPNDFFLGCENLLDESTARWREEEEVVDDITILIVDLRDDGKNNKSKKVEALPKTSVEAEIESQPQAEDNNNVADDDDDDGDVTPAED